MGGNNDNLEFFEDEVDNNNHDKLVHNVLKLNKNQHVKNPSRTEPASKISEFNLVAPLIANKNLIHVDELTKVLKGRKTHVKLSNKVTSTNKRSKTLLKPLEKPQAERIKRSLNYEKTKLQLDRWEAFVSSNRAAPQITFPLDSTEKVTILEKRAETYPSTFRIKSNLQKKLEALEPKIEEYHIDTTEEKDQYPLTLEELKEKRKEAIKLRAHQGFKEAKARRQNKIKSKKYHRILRREKIKQQLKEFEILQKVNPEEALKKLEDIEKARVMERFSLRHKGTGQWARNKQVRAKFDKDSRQELAQQLAISRELTQKLKSVDNDSEDEGSEETSSPTNNKNAENNPWVNGIKPTKEVADFISGYRKYWNTKNQENTDTNTNDESISENSNRETSVDKINKEINKTDKLKTKNEKNINEKVKKSKKEKKNEKVKISRKEKVKKSSNVKKNNTESDSSFSTSEWTVHDLKKKSESGVDVEDIFENLENKLSKKITKKLKKMKVKTKINNKPIQNIKNKINYLSLPSKKKKQILNEGMLEQPKNFDENNSEPNSNLNTLKNIVNSIQKPEEAENINPDKFIEVKQSNLNSAIPDILTTDENEENLDQRDVIMEAFEDDDIAADFIKDKAEEAEKDAPKDIDLNLPGWGSWAGKGISTNKRKRKRFIIKMPKNIPRKDENRGSLIINEKAQAKIKPLLVSDVPFPFKSVKDYEASIRAPIGNTFVPEMAFRRFIEPSVVTKMGTVIEPVNKGILMGVKKV